jgi:quercetin dioxygenase-like cupin family protein
MHTTTRRQLALLFTVLAAEHADARQSNTGPGGNQPVLKGKIYEIEKLAWRAGANPATRSKNLFNGFTTRGQRLTMHMTELAAGQQPHPAARQPHEEILIVEQGTIECTINGQTAQLRPGDVVYSAYNDLKDWKNVGTEPAIYYVISLEEHE